jgi:prefoldin subunit 5
MATFDDCAAAAEAVGWDVTTSEVDEALARYKATLDELRRSLQTLNDKFEANGARGVDLAEELDALRIAIAVRTYREANG